jgi:hypothetical protein
VIARRTWLFPQPPGRRVGRGLAQGIVEASQRVMLAPAPVRKRLWPFRTMLENTRACSVVSLCSLRMSWTTRSRVVVHSRRKVECARWYLTILLHNSTGSLSSACTGATDTHRAFCWDEAMLHAFFYY